MSNQITTQTLSFHGSDLITLKVEDVIYTAVRPIVDALGLSWGSQQRKLENSKEKFSCTHMKTTGSDGKTYEMLCIPIKKLNGWLFSINPEKVRADLKEKVIRYQEECFEALYNYWHFGKAERKTTVDERTGLRNAVNMLVSKKGLIYSDAYNLVHHYMNVESIEDIPAEKLPMAVEYVHRICLTGELIETPKPKTVEIPEPGRWLVLVGSDGKVMMKNMKGCNFVNVEPARQLLQETHFMADQLLELAKRMRLIDGFYEENFRTPLEEFERKTLI